MPAQPKRGPTRVKDVDKGYKEFERQAKRAGKGAHVRIGVQATEAAQKRAFHLTNVTLAAVHEFGSRDGRVPQRSFLRATVDRERPLIQKMLDRAARGVADGGSTEKELGVVGERVKAEVVRTIDQTIGLKPLKASTVARKGSTRPLIDTGQLKASITWEVHKS